MTSAVTLPERPPVPWSMPGWRIVADLTPPELIAARWLAVLRRRILSGLVLVTLLCASGYFYAAHQHSSAADQASAAGAQTAELHRAAQKYAGITRIEKTVAEVRAQIAGFMADDVDLAKVVTKIRAALPASMSIENLTLTITPGTAGTASGGLDTSGHAEIGTVAIAGMGRTLDDLPAFVDHLARIPGVVNVLPTSNLVSAGSAQFNVTLSLTDVLFSHRFDVAKTGGK